MPQLEELEVRTAPACSLPFISGGTLVVNCDNLDNRVEISHFGSTTQVVAGPNGPGPNYYVRSFADSSFFDIGINQGSGRDLVHVRETVRPITVNGGGNRDRAILGTNTVQGIRASVNITNPPAGGYTDVEINNQADTTPHNVTLGHTSTVGTVSGLIQGGDILYRPADLASLTVNNYSSPSTYTVIDTPSSGVPGGPLTKLVVARNSVVNVQRTTGALFVSSLSDPLTVNLGLAQRVRDINGPVWISAINGTATVNVDDRNNDTFRTVTLDTTTLPPGGPPGGPVGLYNRVTGLAPAPIHYSISGSSLANIHTGMAGAVVNVRANNVPTNLFGYSSNTTVNLGNPTNGVQSITAAVTVRNPPSFTTLNINDTGNNQGRTGFHNVNLSSGIATVSGLTPAPAVINYQTADVNNLNVTLGGGNDTFTILRNRANIPLTLNAGGGNDTINVGQNNLTDIFGTLVLNGGTGTNTLNINDGTGTVGQTYTVTGTTLAVSAGPLAFPLGVTYAGVQGMTVNGGSSNDTINLHGTSVPTTINAGGGNDTINVGNGDLDVFNGAVTVNGGAGSDVVHVNDDTAPYSDEYTVTASAVTRLFFAGLTYGTVEALVLNAQPGDNVIRLQSTSVPTTVNGGGGTDSLVGPNAAGTWSITATDAGNRNGATTFASVENLVGGTGDDTFTFADGAGLSGFVGDQGGNATLDYSTWTTGVYVNLTTFEASNVFGGVYGIANVIGGAGDDILVGDDLPNYLAGGPGRDLLIGGGAGYSGLADYLVGGEGEDIVIGGFTAYDTDAAALFAVLAEWTQPTDYYERFVNLYYGIGVPALNEGTVFSNYSYDNVLLGEAGLDLFFGDPSFDATDWDPETETFIPVF